MNKSAFVTALILGSMLSSPVLAERLYADKLGPVVITGKAGEPHKVLIDGQVFVEDKDTWSLTVADGFPNREQPRWVLLGYGTGGNACEGTYRMLDLSGPAPKLSDEIGNCWTYTHLKTDAQVIFDFHKDTWAYLFGRGMIKMPTLNDGENVRQGVDAYKSGDFDRALRHLWPLRAKKNPEAPFYLGLMAHLGKGLPQDYKAAMEFYDAAAKMGYAPAMFRIGSLHANGRGVPKDMSAANLMYKQAALLGDGISQYNLGLNLLTGAGAPKDPKEALFWFLLAKERLVDQKDLDATEKNIRIAEALLTPEEASKVKSSTYGWKPTETKLFATAPELRAWIGRPPWERVNGHTIYDVDELMVRLKMALGDDVAAEMPEMGVAGKGVEQDGWLLIGGCTPHNCGWSHYNLAVNLSTYNVMACVRHEDRNTSGRQFMTYGGTGVTRTQWPVSDRERDDCADLTVAGLKGRMFTPASGQSRPIPAPQIAAAPPPTSAPAPKAPERSSGSGYAVDASGTVVTNNHVVEGCRVLAIRRGQQVVPATLVATDAKNDLAAVKGALPGLLPIKFRDGKGIRAADGVVAMGYPYAGLLATTPQVTTGTITALAGIGDDTRYLQISAPIQPGNSGGPLFDLSGNVVGTNAATLDALLVAKATGSVPQNINFAIKSGVVREFLDAKGLSYQTAASTAKLEAADVGEIGSKSVVMVECSK